jgi:osmotically-inducible protein OsmY
MDTEQSSWRSGGDYGSYDEPGRRYSGRRSDFDRDYTSERDRRFTGGGYSGRSGYSGGNYGRGSYGSDFPESERGYMTGRSSQEDRGWLDRASDTVSSWLGDEEAERRLRNEERRGEFRGRGPRNYTRSDERIREDINDRLTDADYLDASEIDVQVNNGEVILTGTVDSRWAKRHAEDIAEDVSSVKNVENRIRVNQTTYGLESSSFTGTTGSTSSTGSTETTGKPKGRSATG